MSRSAPTLYFNEQLQCYLYTCCQMDSRTGNIVCTNPGSHGHPMANIPRAYDQSQGSQSHPSRQNSHHRSGSSRHSSSHQSGRSPRPPHGNSGSGWEGLMASPGSRSGSSRQSGNGWAGLMDNSNSASNSGSNSGSSSYRPVMGWADLMEPSALHSQGVPEECLYGIHDAPCRCWTAESGLPPPPPQGTGKRNYSRDPFWSQHMHGGSGPRRQQTPPPPPPPGFGSAGSQSGGSGWGAFMR